ncbi:MAG: radical SAM protein [Proteobacteria bacterium]|nr:radical SAM protein [Pseudomonadota bacterium]
MPAILRVGLSVPDTEAEGPGRRFAIWVQGCPLRCKGCCNPELFAFSGGIERATDDLAAEIANTPGIEGVSFLGGEPFSHVGAVLDVARRVRAGGLSIMIFTGFTLAELRARRRADIDELIALTDLLVDGRYRRDLPETRRRWIGSSNQIMHFLTDRYSATDPQFYRRNTVEIRLSRDGLLVNGWPGAADALATTLTTCTDDRMAGRPAAALRMNSTAHRPGPHATKGR